MARSPAGRGRGGGACAGGGADVTPAPLRISRAPVLELLPLLLLPPWLWRVSFLKCAPVWGCSAAGFKPSALPRALLERPPARPAVTEAFSPPHFSLFPSGRLFPRPGRTRRRQEGPPGVPKRPEGEGPAGRWLPKRPSPWATACFKYRYLPKNNNNYYYLRLEEL